jgi:hypothetical protein
MTALYDDVTYAWVKIVTGSAVNWCDLAIPADDLIARGPSKL